MYIKRNITSREGHTLHTAIEVLGEAAPELGNKAFYSLPRPRAPAPVVGGGRRGPGGPVRRQKVPVPAPEARQTFDRTLSLKPLTSVCCPSSCKRAYQKLAERARCHRTSAGGAAGGPRGGGARRRGARAGEGRGARGRAAARRGPRVTGPLVKPYKVRKTVRNLWGRRTPLVYVMSPTLRETWPSCAWPPSSPPPRSG